VASLTHLSEKVEESHQSNSTTRGGARMETPNYSIMLNLDELIDWIGKKDFFLGVNLRLQESEAYMHHVKVSAIPWWDNM
jgi:hypothetical protein